MQSFNDLVWKLLPFTYYTPLTIFKFILFCLVYILIKENPTHKKVKNEFISERDTIILFKLYCYTQYFSTLSTLALFDKMKSHNKKIIKRQKNIFPQKIIPRSRYKVIIKKGNKFKFKLGLQNMRNVTRVEMFAQTFGKLRAK